MDETAPFARIDDDLTDDALDRETSIAKRCTPCSTSALTCCWIEDD